MPYTLFTTPFGTCGLSWNDAGLTGFQLPEPTPDRTEVRMAARAGDRAGDPPEWVQDLIERIRLHLGGQPQDFADTPLDESRVGAFQREVYRLTSAVKPGFKTSYGEIARQMGQGPGAARAVGAALATNPWPLIVPCHRVVSAADTMHGFSAPGGIRTKTRLLTLEGAELLSE
jgi:methylated-DNA-[protein]-cysteine S-methyltransferase